jgi:hypothetical protein
MKRLRDDKNELPPDFGDYTNHWSLESITFITLSKRLGLLRENYSDPNAEKLIKVRSVDSAKLQLNVYFQKDKIHSDKIIFFRESDTFL